MTEFNITTDKQVADKTELNENLTNTNMITSMVTTTNQTLVVNDGTATKNILPYILAPIFSVLLLGLIGIGIIFHKKLRAGLNIFKYKESVSNSNTKIPSAIRVEDETYTACYVEDEGYTAYCFEAT